MKSTETNNGYKKKFPAILMAVGAAAVYGLSAPISKLLLKELSPTFIAALLYLGAGLGMLIVNIVKSILVKEQKEAKVTKNEMPYIVTMVFLDILAPILLIVGLSMTTSSNTSLLNNFEIVATSLIALLIFKESISKRMWVAIALITLSTIILSFEGVGAFSFSIGSVFVISACICWGIENNCTRKLSLKDPLQIVVIKGIGSGSGALLIAIVVNGISNNIFYILCALLLGFIAYGFGIFMYIMAQRELGAARTSAYYATAPFIGVITSWILLNEGITITFLVALAVMLLGAYFATTEKHKHTHLHTQETHDHMHNHFDGHHNHTHGNDFSGEHSHMHTHQETSHEHDHLPDLHHRHSHS